jgi:hypothetical protein
MAVAAKAVGVVDVEAVPEVESGPTAAASHGSGDGGGGDDDDV